MVPPQFRASLLAISFAMIAALVRAATGLAETAESPTLTTAEIVQRIHQHDQEQRAHLRQYRAVRHYEVDYHGLGKVSATTDVEITYSASGKSFRVVAASGSALLGERVFDRAIESEREASLDPAASALSEANYRFHLAGMETIAGRPAYILDLDPIKPSTFLLRGKFWIDAEDFAVVKMDAEPAKNPSFWISRTMLHTSSVKLDGFWLPHRLQSESKMRLGGTAVLTIDYGRYTIDR